MTVETEQVRELLRQLGAESVPHPGGSLFAHLDQVRGRLADWGARPALQLAGLCHAFYGTDGFPTALLPLDRRAELRAAIGPEAEAIVHLYASCDRKATYPVLADRGHDGFRTRFHDRFTGTSSVPGPGPRADFAELTAANELDLAERNTAFRAAWGPALLVLFTGWRPLLSEPAWHDCRAVLPDTL